MSNPLEDEMRALLNRAEIEKPTAIWRLAADIEDIRSSGYFPMSSKEVEKEQRETIERLKRYLSE